MKKLNDFSKMQLINPNSINGGWYWLLGLGLAILNTDWDKAGSDFGSGLNAGSGKP